MNVISPKVDTREGNAEFGKQMESVHMSAGNTMLRCSRTTSSALLRAELGMYPLDTTSRDEVKMAIQSKEHAKKEVASHS